MSRRWSLLLCMVVGTWACRDGERRRAGFQPLLGKRTDAAISHFRESCDVKFAPVNPNPFGDPPFAQFSMDEDVHTLHLQCEMSNYTDYSVMFFLDNISFIYIYAPTEAERLGLFDRVFAPLVPDDVREPMRRSISNPEGFRFDAPTGYGGVRLDASRKWPKSIRWTAE